MKDVCPSENGTFSATDAIDPRDPIMKCIGLYKEAEICRGVLSGQQDFQQDQIEIATELRSLNPVDLEKRYITTLRNCGNQSNLEIINANPSIDPRTVTPMQNFHDMIHCKDKRLTTLYLLSSTCFYRSYEEGLKKQPKKATLVERLGLSETQKEPVSKADLMTEVLNNVLEGANLHDEENLLKLCKVCSEIRKGKHTSDVENQLNQDILFLSELLKGCRQEASQEQDSLKSSTPSVTSKVSIPIIAAEPIAPDKKDSSIEEELTDPIEAYRIVDTLNLLLDNDDLTTNEKDELENRRKTALARSSDLALAEISKSHAINTLDSKQTFERIDEDPYPNLRPLYLIIEANKTLTDIYGYSKDIVDIESTIGIATNEALKNILTAGLTEANSKKTELQEVFSQISSELHTFILSRDLSNNTEIGRNLYQKEKLIKEQLRQETLTLEERDETEKEHKEILNELIAYVRNRLPKEKSTVDTKELENLQDLLVKIDDPQLRELSLAGQTAILEIETYKKINDLKSGYDGLPNSIKILVNREIDNIRAEASLRRKKLEETSVQAVPVTEKPTNQIHDNQDIFVIPDDPQKLITLYKEQLAELDALDRQPKKNEQDLHALEDQHRAVINALYERGIMPY